MMSHTGGRVPTPGRSRAKPLNPLLSVPSRPDPVQSPHTREGPKGPSVQGLRFSGDAVRSLEFRAVVWSPGAGWLRMIAWAVRCTEKSGLRFYKTLECRYFSLG